MARSGLVSGIPSSLTDINSTLTCFFPVHTASRHIVLSASTALEALSVLDMIYSDSVDSLVHSAGGAKHAGTFPDAKTRYTAIRGLAKKGDMVAATRQVLAQYAVQQGNTAIIYQTDGAKEKKSGTKAEWYANQGIIQLETFPYTPQHNGIAEWYNRVHFDRVRTCLLLGAAKDQTSVDIMRRMFCCNFLRKSRL
jgi:hypothetical protein